MRPGKPNDDPKAQPDHEDYDPFHLPMPTLKTGKQRQPRHFAKHSEFVAGTAVAWRLQPERQCRAPPRQSRLAQRMPSTQWTLTRTASSR